MKYLSVIAIRVLAVYLVVTALNHAAPIFLIPDAWDSFREMPVIALAAYLFTPLITGLLLWFFAPALSSKVPSETTKPLTEEGLISAGSFLIGIFLFVKYTGLTLGQLQGISRQTSDISDLNWANPVIIIFSIFLITGSRYTILLFRKFRYFGNHS